MSKTPYIYKQIYKYRHIHFHECKSNIVKYNNNNNI